MGFPLTTKTSVYCDNQAVVHNASKVESTLKKKHLSVCYHFVRESCAKGAICIAYESTATNLADVCTKIMSWFQKKDKLRCILYWYYNYDDVHYKCTTINESFSGTETVASMRRPRVRDESLCCPLRWKKTFMFLELPNWLTTLWWLPNDLLPNDWLPNNWLPYATQLMLKDAGCHK